MMRLTFLPAVPKISNPRFKLPPSSLHAYNETYTNENSGMVARHWRLYKEPEFLSASATPPPLPPI